MLALIALSGLLDALRQGDQRVAAIAWRLQTANAAICARTVPLAGFSIQTLDQFAPAERDAAARTFGLGDLPQVSAVAPGSAADKAGLKVGDEIVAVDGQAMPGATAAKSGYDRTAAVEAILADALTRPPVTLALRSRTITFAGDAGCASGVQLVPGSRFDARADGRYVQITGVLYEFAANDDELAFIIAHELAHNCVKGAERTSGGSAQRQAELAADRAGIGMMQRAGYDVNAVVPLLERLSRRNRLAWLDGSHPAWPTRLAAARRAIVAAAEQSRPN